MKYLLLVHIGPVQDFIASARRTRDLKFGSWMLSELAKAGALAVATQHGRDSLIFPAPDDLKHLSPRSPLNVPNKLVAIVDAPDETAIKDLAGKKIKDAVWGRLQEIRDQAFQQIHGDYYEDTAVKQVNDLPEFYWVAASLENGSYKQVRSDTEALLAARKGTRNFTAVPWTASSAPKSSLDGAREAVVDEKYYALSADADERLRQIEKLFRICGARPAEFLSGVDLVKRLGEPDSDARFPSTSHMAALPLLQRLNAAGDLRKTWQPYMALLDKTSPVTLPQLQVPERYTFDAFQYQDKFIDGSVLFPSRLREILEEPVLKKAGNALTAFLNAGRAGQASPYYALLLGDGDRMGKSIDAQGTADGHQALSVCLEKFARSVVDIVEGAPHHGALVYAGGDDVLAFLPLHTAVKCARKLAEEFQKQMVVFSDSEGQTPTFSAGIAICHHLEPLANALKLARDAEKLAKNEAGRNALAIAVDKRSGSTRTIYGKWETLAGRLVQFIDFYRQDMFPAGAAYELRDMALDLGGASTLENQPSLRAVLEKESERILGRKRAERGGVDVAGPVLAFINQAIAGKTVPVERLADELIIAQLLAAAQDQAFGPLKKEEV